jgi:hypothetical protein
LHVLWNGDCTLCCWDYDGEQIVGNVKKNSLVGIFYSEKANEWRKNLAEGNWDYLPVCKRCFGPSG